MFGSVGKELRQMVEDQNETLGTVIKRKRTEIGLTLRDLAEKTDVHYATINRIENGQIKVVDSEIITKIAEQLHLDRMYLLSLNGAGIEDGDIRIIARAANQMSAEQRQKMMEMLRGSFAEVFRRSESDDLDKNRDEYFDEPV